MSEAGTVVAHITCDYGCRCYYHVSPNTRRLLPWLTSFGVDLTTVTVDIGAHHKFFFHTQGASCENAVIAVECHFVRPEFNFLIVQGLGTVRRRANNPIYTTFISYLCRDMGLEARKANATFMLADLGRRFFGE
jgi:hypothetical protein